MATKKPAAKAAEPVEKIEEVVEEVEKTEPEIDLNAYYNEIVTVELFKDNEKYKDDVFVGWNGKRYMIRRGEPVRVPRGVALILDRSRIQEQAAIRYITENSK